MSTLLIDNYDSYTYNIFHLLAAASGEEPIVVHNDAVSWRALERWDFDAIVLSPGPGRPDRWHDFGVCADILRSSEVPILGVCLGHQGLGQLLGADITTAPIAMHGRLSQVRHTADNLFEGIPQGFSVVRYHSLAVTGSLGDQGRVIAWTKDGQDGADGVVMGIEHAQRPLWGVQFHPESIATEYGHRLFENFYALARRRRPPRTRPLQTPLVPPRRARKRNTDSGWSLQVRTIEGEPQGELLFERLFGNAEHAFWLDSADAPSPLAQSSYMGATIGPNRKVLEYDVQGGLVTSHRAGQSTTEHGSIFDVLDRELQARQIQPPSETTRGPLGGFVGYLGYECKADCGSSNVHNSENPDAVLMYANRVVAVDHIHHRTHLLAVCDGDELEADRWLTDTEAITRDALNVPAEPSQPAANVSPATSDSGGGLLFLSPIVRSPFAPGAVASSTWPISRAASPHSPRASHMRFASQTRSTPTRAQTHGSYTGFCGEATPPRSRPT